MDRPSKRPRLSIFDQSPYGEELDVARYNNDMTLKNRFESIFSKYAQDFTGIGDEIDLVTGELLVNNGHLESIETETDPGIDHLAGDFSSTGRSMLRAMTVTLNPDLPGPDDVFTSIETIAENAAFADDMSTGESEDNLFNTSRSTGSRSTSATNGIENVWYNDSMEPYNSDGDSLFDEEKTRSGSADSLFGSGIIEKGDTPNQPKLPEFAEAIPSTTYAMNDDNDVVARFGPHVGKEVLNLIGQRQEAHIEPAWRIPVKLDTAPARRLTPRLMSSASVEDSPVGKQKSSLWKLPRPKKKRTPKENAPTYFDREESIDPLQGDFSSESETLPQPRLVEEPTWSKVDLEPEDVFCLDILVQASASGDCVYCQMNFRDKSGVMAHWDRWIRHAHKRFTADDPHDLDTMKKIRSKALIRTRLPRLVVYDFRTMVELHEGAGLSFNEIVASKTLRTRKTGLQLQEIYNKHRTPPAWNEPTGVVQEWTQAEEEALQELCKNPLATMTTLRRGLKSHDELEIGNHLAEIWLAQLGVNRQQAVTSQLPDQRVDTHSSTTDYEPATDMPVNAEGQSEGLDIKQEDSDDELFTQR